MSSIRILVLEDDKNTLQYIKELLEEKEYSVYTEIDSTQWVTRISQGDFDLVVTDLMEGQEEGIRPGDMVVELITKNQLVPIIVHSGYSQLHEHFEKHGDNPLVKVISKTDSGIHNVSIEVGKFTPIATTLRELRELVRSELNRTLTATTHAIASSDVDLQETLPHIVKRRLSAALEDPLRSEKYIHPIERYLIPPVSRSLLTGDIIKDKNEQGEYRLVLTPSCDLAWEVVSEDKSRQPRKPKVDKVLVAPSVSPGRVKSRVRELREALNERANPTQPSPSLDDNRADEKAKSRVVESANSLAKVVGDLASLSNKTGIVLLPAIPGTLNEPLFFDLKQLELVELKLIEGGCAESAKSEPFWRRVASQDSPFREQITWAFISQMGRPALPDTNQNVLVDQVRSWDASSRAKS